MAQTDAEQRNAPLGCGGYGVQADAGTVGIAGTRRQHDSVRPQIERLRGQLAEAGAPGVGAVATGEEAGVEGIDRF